MKNTISTHQHKPKIVIIPAALAVIITIIVALFLVPKSEKYTISASNATFSYYLTEPSEGEKEILEKGFSIVKDYVGDSFIEPDEVVWTKRSLDSDDIRGLAYTDNKLYLTSVRPSKYDDLLCTIVHELLHFQNMDGFSRKLHVVEPTYIGEQENEYVYGLTFNEMVVEALTLELVGEDLLPKENMTQEGRRFFEIPLLVKNKEKIFKNYISNNSDILSKLLKGDKTYQIMVGNTCQPVNVPIVDFFLVTMDNDPELISAPIELKEQLYCYENN